MIMPKVISLYSRLIKCGNEPLYKKVVEETHSFLDKEYENPEGGLFAGHRCDSEGEKASFYVWKEEELKSNFRVQILNCSPNI